MLQYNAIPGKNIVSTINKQKSIDKRAVMKRKGDEKETICEDKGNLLLIEVI